MDMTRASRSGRPAPGSSAIFSSIRNGSTDISLRLKSTYFLANGSIAPTITNGFFTPCNGRLTLPPSYMQFSIVRG